MKNIDVIYNLVEVCHKADSINARLNSICQIEDMDIFDICETEYQIYIDQMIVQILSASALLRLLTEDYKQKLYDTEFCASEFLADVERITLDKMILCEEWDSIIEQIWSLEAFCETEIKVYLKMTQECYRYEFEPIEIIIREARICQSDFWETPNCADMKQ